MPWKGKQFLLQYRHFRSPGVKTNIHTLHLSRANVIPKFSRIALSWISSVMSLINDIILANQYKTCNTKTCAQFNENTVSPEIIVCSYFDSP